MQYIKLSIYVWSCIMLTNFAFLLESSFSSVCTSHAESTNRLHDCQSHVYALRYPKDCAEIILNPPKSFWTTWFGVAFNNVNWCGALHCDDVFSFKGMAIMWIVAVLFRIPFYLFRY